VPPSGRNAGVPLGGNARGKKRFDLERELDDPSTRDEGPVTEETSSHSEDAPHPLGDAALDDD